MFPFPSFRTSTLALALSLGLTSGAATAATFLPLGDLPGGGFTSFGLWGANDGSVVVGYADIGGSNPSGSPPPFEAFRWTRSGGMTGTGLRIEPPAYPNATGASDDGSVLVGFAEDYSSGSLRIVPFRGTAEAGAVTLQGLTSREATGVSADGSVIVGRFRSAQGNLSCGAFIWRESTGMVSLRTSGPEVLCDAMAVSADGSVVVGDGSRGFGNEAYRWTAASGAQSLQSGPPSVESTATAVSPDGLVISGVLFDSQTPGGIGQRGFVWTDATGLVPLENRPGRTNLVARAVSDSGVVAGWDQGINEIFFGQAILGTTAGGVRRLFDVLVDGGATGLAGWNLVAAHDISADGRWVIGTGINPDGNFEAFLADVTPVPAPASVWLLGTALAAGVGRRHLRRTLLVELGRPGGRAGT